MIFKVLAVIAVLFLVYMVLFKKKREQEIKSKKSKKDEQISDEMIECSVCGTFVSKDEAILSDAKYYCSKECIK